MDYKTIFTAPYDRDAWQQLLHDIFLSKAQFFDDLYRRSVEVNTSIATTAYHLGKIVLSDVHTLGVYEAELAESIDIAHNRRGIRDLFTAHWRGQGYVGAFVIAYRKEESSIRFSYVSETWGINAAGQYARLATDTKRFTYLLGAGYSCRTAVQQFEKLKSSDKTLRDITAAFSVEALSQEFFGKYTHYYDKFVKVLSDSDAKVATFAAASHTQGDDTHKAIRDFVKKQLGRIVFLHFLQRKGWLGVPQDKEWGQGSRDFMQQLFSAATEEQKDNFLDRVLVPLCANALDCDRGDDSLYDTGVAACGTVRIPYLNGGLFECNATDWQAWHIPQRLFRDLFAMLSEYNFTIDENDPDDAEVGVDPEMLGRIFENLLEDNKDKGAYYTPKEIVQYMCRESLVAYLQTGLSAEKKDAVRQFVTTHDAEPIEDIKEAIRQRLRAVRICDPAIGSGAFPMGLLRELFSCRMAIGDGAEKTAAAIKREIIQQNIYGVDIESGAVEIARLRFWLALVVDEQSPKTLPNLDFKIMQGNSLLEEYHGIDLSKLTDKKTDTDPHTGLQVTIYDTELDALRCSLLNMLAAYYSCADHKARLHLRDEIKEMVRKEMAANHTKEDLSGVDIYATPAFFLWHTWFADVFAQGGFDIVIGNPPYISLQNNQGAVGAPYKNAGYATFVKTGDIYCLFYERGLQLLKGGGVLCLITSNKWLRAGYGEKLRGYLATKSNPRLLIDFAGTRLFENATVDTNILLATKGDNEGATRCATFGRERRTTSTNITEVVAETATTNTFPDSAAWVLLTDEEQALKAKIEKVGTPLSKWDISINYGIKTGCNEAFVITAAQREALLAVCHDDNERQRTDRLLRPLLRGRDIKRYGYQWADLYLINTHNGVRGRLPRIDINDYPAVKHWLDVGGIAYNGKIYRGYEQLAARNDQGDTPYNLRSCDYLQEFAKPKIVYPETTQGAFFAYDDKGMMLDKTCFMLLSPHAKYLQASLSSKLFEFAYKRIYSSIELGANGYQYNKHALLKLPICTTYTPQDEYSDEYFFALYHLTAEEVAYIRAATAENEGAAPTR